MALTSKFRPANFFSDKEQTAQVLMQYNELLPGRQAAAIWSSGKAICWNDDDRGDGEYGTKRHDKEG